MVSEVGWAFWSRNEYTISNIMMTGDVTDVSAQMSVNTFWLSEDEYQSLEYIKLKYFPDCAQGEAEGITIKINSNTVFSGIPDCGIINSIEFSPGIAISGLNELTFGTSGGDYLIDSISVETELEEPVYPTYYFELEQEEIDDIADNLFDINITLEFTNEEDFKKGKLIINGRTTHFQTYDHTYTRALNEFVEEGTNSLELLPDKTDLNIRELRLEIAKVD